MDQAGSYLDFMCQGLSMKFSGQIQIVPSDNTTDCIICCLGFASGRLR